MKKENLKRFITSLILIPLTFFFIIKGSYFFTFFLSVCFFVTVYEWYMMSSKKKYFYPGLFFLFFSFFSIYLFRSDQSEEVFILFLAVILICIATDIGGFFFGKIFKGPKITKISPNKTYAGMFGGYFLSIILINIFLQYTYIVGHKDNEFTLELFFLVILISSMSQIGDLTISYFKRLSKVKNTGIIIPGHGGLLDRIDGMIFAFPFSYIIIKIF